MEKFYLRKEPPVTIPHAAITVVIMAYISALCFIIDKVTIPHAAITVVIKIEYGEFSKSDNVTMPQAAITVVIFNINLIN